MAKAELLEMPVVGEVLSWTGAFPVRRWEVDRDALREARRLVREGHVVGIHVEAPGSGSAIRGGAGSGRRWSRCGKAFR
jgi:1-acyl-sn-glycerol-3-phosphate acyltransferase